MCPHPPPPPPPLSASAAALCLRRRFRLGFCLRSSSEEKKDQTISSHLGEVARLKDVSRETVLLQFTAGFKKNRWWFYTAFPATTLMGLSSFNGDRNESNEDIRKTQSMMFRRDLSDGRQWTNILLAANVSNELFLKFVCKVYIAQSLSDGKLLYWGAKINGLIKKGQLWRLVTSSFLHANPVHLLVNCYSLNSMGPAVEKTSGPRRYLAVYFTSAIASSAMSYWLNKAPAVGASGAIFGLVGSYAMFVLRHRGVIKGTDDDLRHIAQVIVLNMTIGLLSKGIDNWGHVGGLIGGAAVSWFLGPIWRFKSVSLDGSKKLTD